MIFYLTYNNKSEKVERKLGVYLYKPPFCFKTHNYNFYTPIHLCLLVLLVNSVLETIMGKVKKRGRLPNIAEPIIELVEAVMNGIKDENQEEGGGFDGEDILDLDCGHFVDSFTRYREVCIYKHYRRSTYVLCIAYYFL